MSETTPNLTLPYILAAQAQKHVTHNEAIRMLDALVQISVLDRDLATPPPTPVEGDRYIVAAAATGAWSGQETSIAAFQDGAWAFYQPKQGWLAWVGDEDDLLAWSGSQWVSASSGASGINPAPLVGVNTTADATNKLAVKSDAVLFSHDDVTPGSGSAQFIVNKRGPADTTSMVLQTGFSGRSEIGLAGDDDTHFKVSPDGTNWHEAATIRSADALFCFAPKNYSDLPAAGASAGCIAYVQDAVGGPTLAASDGTDWRSLFDGSTVTGNTFPLLIFTGESNAGGLALNSDPTAGELAARAELDIFNNTTSQFEDLDVEANNLIGHTGLTDNATHGLEIGLANTVAAGRWPVGLAYLVKTGQGGSTIADWADGHASGYWATFQTRVQAAKALLDGAGTAYAPIVFYSLGINDAAAGTPATTWKTDTEAHLAKIRTELGAATRIYITRFEGAIAPGNDTYNTEMDAIAAADPLTFVLDTSVLSVLDGDHWDYQGFLVLAEQLADLENGTTGTLAAPSFTPPPGTFGTNTDVSISASAGATIRYTLDDTPPTSHSPVYSGPVTVTQTSTLKAVAMQAGYKNSPETSGQYVISGASATEWSAADAGTDFILSNNNLDLAAAVRPDAWLSVRATNGRSTGKHYIELKCAAAGTNAFHLPGFGNAAMNVGSFMGDSASSVGVASNAVYGNNFTILEQARVQGNPVLGEVYGFAIDMDTGKVWMAHNNTWLQSGDPAGGTTPFATFVPATVGELFPGISMYNNTAGTWTIQALAADQDYAPPAGFSAWG